MQIFAAALAGLNAAEVKLDQSAERLSRVGVAAGDPAGDTVDLSTEMVNLLTAKEAYAANLKSLEAGSELVKHTLDLLA